MYLNAARALSPRDQIALRTSTRFMETYRVQRPLSAGTGITTYENSQGSLDLFTVGTGDEVFRLSPTTGEHAPYEATDLSIQARELFLFDESTGRVDRPSILGLNGKGELTLSSFQPGTGIYSQKVCQPVSASHKIRRFLGVRGTTGNIYANVILDDGRLANNFLEPGSARKWGGPDWAPVKGPDGQDAKVLDIAVTANNPVQSAIFAIGLENEVLFAEDSFRFSNLKKLGDKRAVGLCVVTDGDGLLNAFAVEKGSGRLLLKRQRKYSTGSGIQFEDWIYVDSTQAAPLVRVFAGLRFDGVLEVFAISEDGTLHHTYQQTDERGKVLGWDPLLQLGEEIGNAIFTVGRNSSHYSEVYTVTREGLLRRFWQAPDTTQWFSEIVQIAETSDEVVRIPTHSAEITVLDENGLAVPRARVSISASFLTTLFINGVAYRVSALETADIETDETGRVTILQQANGLAGATLFIETPFTFSGMPLQVEPNAELQERLGKLDAQKILDAKDASGQPLLPAQYRSKEYAESLAQISRQSMKIAQAEEPASAVAFKAFSRDPRKFGFRRRLDVARLEEEAWEIDFSSGFPQYRGLSLAEADSWLSDRRIEMASVEGFLGIDWGDAWNAIKNGATWIWDGLTKIVTKIANGIVSVFFYIGTKVFEAVIEFAQQAFDFVEGVWNWLKVAFEKLYQWLALLFDWPAIQRTAEGIRHSVNATLDFTVIAVEKVRDQVAAGIDALKGEVKKGLDDFIAQIDGEPTLGQFAGQYGDGDKRITHAGDHNILLNAFKDNYKGTKVKTSFQDNLRDSGVQGSIDSLVNELIDLGNNFQFGDGKQAFDEAVGYFTNVGEQPDRAVQLILSGSLKAVEAGALFALDAAKGVVLTVFDLIVDVIEGFKALLNEVWEIPIVSQIYKAITNKSLGFRPIDLFAYILAIPVNLGFIILFDKVPFPSQADLDKFKSQFTADWIAEQSGVKTTTTATELVGGAAAFFKDLFLTVYMFAVTPVRLVLDTLTADGSAAGVQVPGVPQMAVIARFVTTLATMPWVVSPGTPFLECGAGKKGFAGWIWLSQLVLGPTRGALILWALATSTPKARAWAGEISLSLWGLTHLIMIVVQYGMLPEGDRNAAGLARDILVTLPGQTLRFGALQELNADTYAIPLLILMLLIGVGYGGSSIATVFEINGRARDEAWIQENRIPVLGVA
ncbi:MAG: hypothetical protein K8J08_08855 [Thermoanaerobaculia bacterium]|nr:hypothetical protein [Thermoanaerobaculia bacterium]